MLIRMTFYLQSWYPIFDRLWSHFARLKQKTPSQIFYISLFQSRKRCSCQKNWKKFVQALSNRGLKLGGKMEKNAPHDPLCDFFQLFVPCSYTISNGLKMPYELVSYTSPYGLGLHVSFYLRKNEGGAPRHTGCPKGWSLLVFLHLSQG